MYLGEMAGSDGDLCGTPLDLSTTANAELEGSGNGIGVNCGEGRAGAVGGRTGRTAGVAEGSEDVGVAES